MELKNEKLKNNENESVDFFGYEEDLENLEEAESILSPAVFVGPWFLIVSS